MRSSVDLKLTAVSRSTSSPKWSLVAAVNGWVDLMSLSRWMALPAEGKGHTLRPIKNKYRENAAFTKIDAIVELLLAVAL